MAKIQMLEQDTKRAFSNCPGALKQKLDHLAALRRSLNTIKEEFITAKSEMDKSRQTGGLIINENANSGLISGADALRAYALLSTNPTKNIKTPQERTVYSDSITTQEVEDSLKELKKDDWSFEKLNANDSRIYPTLCTQLIFGDIKRIITEQVKLINEKLAQLKNEKGMLTPEVGLKVYTPKITGQILALETAKLRRTHLQSEIKLPDIEEKLSKPDILAQPIPTGLPIFFKIDKSFVPTKPDFQEVCKLNKPYKPVLNTLFPDGLPVFMVPGYIDDKYGEIEGGFSIPGYPDNGVWLNSYNYDDRYVYTSGIEYGLSALKGIQNFKPSVLSGKKDRARALAHEIGHAVHYKIEQSDQQNADLSTGLTKSLKISFLDGLKMLRIRAQFKEGYKKRSSKLMQDDYLNNLDQSDLYDLFIILLDILQ